MSLVVRNQHMGFSSFPVPLLGPATTVWEGVLRVESGPDGRAESYATALKDPLEATSNWLQPRMSTVADVSSIIRPLESIFTFVRPPEVKAFLSDNSYLIPLLFDAREQLSRYFGQNAPVFLEVVSDPGSAGDSQLFALVETSMSPQEAFNALDRLDQYWWLDAGVQSRGNLEIDVKFL